MAKSYRLTAKRKIALRKAQLVSARKRKGKGLSSRTKRNAAIGVTGVTTAVMLGGAAYGRHKLSGSQVVMVNGKREPTPMINIVGVEVPGTRAGIRIARYKGSRQGFALSVVSRNSSGDKTLLSYRHRQLSKGAVQAAVFGKKPWGYGAMKKGWTPAQASPKDIDMDIINSYPYRTGGRSNTWRLGAFTDGARGRRGSQRVISTAKKQNETSVTQGFLINRRIITSVRGGRIDGVEARARLRDYQRQMDARGIIVNREHLSKAERQLRKQTY
jgi:hypothetical protein